MVLGTCASTNVEPVLEFFSWNFKVHLHFIKYFICIDFDEAKNFEKLFTEFLRNFTCMYSLSSGLGTIHDLDGITVNKKLENETYELFYNNVCFIKIRTTHKM